VGRLGYREIFGVQIWATTADIAVDTIVERFHAGRPQRIGFANANLLTMLARGEISAATLRCLDLLNDGVGLDIASRIIHGRAFPANLNGTDLTPALLRALAGSTVFLYGAREGVVKAAAGKFREQYGVTVCGFVHGYGPKRDAVVDLVNQSGADILLVALGNPTQERWISTHSSQLQPRLVIGVGAFLDFVAGRFPRAPTILRRLRLEWLYRLALEPKRLLRRYSVDAACFLYFAWSRRRARGRENSWS
jgi:exopolysaccharide biosynthesis WecB/TagA/CpsF family protein